MQLTILLHVTRHNVHGNKFFSKHLRIIIHVSQIFKELIDKQYTNAMQQYMMECRKSSCHSIYKSISESEQFIKLVYKFSKTFSI